MTQSPKRLAVLVGAIAILALALAAVAPVLAQEGTGGQGGQTGTPVPLEDDDTLGSLVNQYNFTGDNLRRFFSQNWDLVLEDNQTVVFPADVDVTFGADAEGFADVDVEGRQTYLTQEGDTLGDVLGFTGFVRLDDETGMAGGDTAATPTLAAGGAGDTGTTGGNVVSTPTVDDGDAATTPTAADADAATTPTVAGGDTTSDTGATGTVGADLTDDQLEAFLDANQDLVFVDGQMVMIPAGVPVTGMTGQDAQATPTLAAGGASDTTQATATVATGDTTQATPTVATGDTAQATPTGEETTAEGVTADTTTYTTQLGDTLTSIADQFGITVEQLVEMNPDLIQPGMTLNVPATQGQVPQTGGTAGQTDVTPTAAVGDAVQATPTVAAGAAGGQTDPTETPIVSDALQATPTVATGDTVVATPTVAAGDTAQATPTATAATGDTTQVTPTATAAVGDTTQVTPTPAAGDTGTVPQTGQQGQEGQANPNLVTVCTGDAPDAQAGVGLYRYGGESLQFLADQTNSTVGDIIAMNGANAFISGNIIRLPAAEAPGFWKNELLRDCTTVDLTGRSQAPQGQVPQTGAAGDTAGIPQTGQQSQANPNLVTVCTDDAPEAQAGSGLYRYRGESLQFLADRTNSTVGDIIALNGADAFISGNIIRLPGAEAPGFWNNNLLRSCTTVDVTTRNQQNGAE